MLRNATPDKFVDGTNFLSQHGKLAPKPKNHFVIPPKSANGTTIATQTDAPLFPPARRTSTAFTQRTSSPSRLSISRSATPGQAVQFSLSGGTFPGCEPDLGTRPLTGLITKRHKHSSRGGSTAKHRPQTVASADSLGLPPLSADGEENSASLKSSSVSFADASEQKQRAKAPKNSHGPEISHSTMEQYSEFGRSMRKWNTRVDKLFERYDKDTEFEEARLQFIRTSDDDYYVTRDRVQEMLAKAQSTARRETDVLLSLQDWTAKMDEHNTSNEVLLETAASEMKAYESGAEPFEEAIHTGMISHHRLGASHEELVGRLKERLAYLSSQLRPSDELKKLRKWNEKNQMTISDLEDQLRKALDAVASHVAQEANNKRILGKLKGDNEILRTEFTAAKKRIEEFEEEVRLLKKRDRELEKKIAEMVPSSETISALNSAKEQLDLKNTQLKDVSSWLLKVCVKHFGSVVYRTQDAQDLLESKIQSFVWAADLQTCERVLEGEPKEAAQRRLKHMVGKPTYAELEKQLEDALAQLTTQAKTMPVNADIDSLMKKRSLLQEDVMLTQRLLLKAEEKRDSVDEECQKLDNRAAKEKEKIERLKKEVAALEEQRDALARLAAINPHKQPEPTIVTVMQPAVAPSPSSSAPSPVAPSPVGALSDTSTSLPVVHAPATRVATQDACTSPHLPYPPSPLTVPFQAPESSLCPSPVHSTPPSRPPTTGAVPDRYAVTPEVQGQIDALLAESNFHYDQARIMWDALSDIKQIAQDLCHVHGLIPAETEERLMVPLVKLNEADVLQLFDADVALLEEARLFFTDAIFRVVKVTTVADNKSTAAASSPTRGSAASRLRNAASKAVSQKTVVNELESMLGHQHALSAHLGGAKTTAAVQELYDTGHRRLSSWTKLRLGQKARAALVNEHDEHQQEAAHDDSKLQTLPDKKSASQRLRTLLSTSLLTVAHQHHTSDDAATTSEGASAQAMRKSVFRPAGAKGSREVNAVVPVVGAKLPRGVQQRFLRAQGARIEHYQEVIHDAKQVLVRREHYGINPFEMENELSIAKANMKISEKRFARLLKTLGQLDERRRHVLETDKQLRRRANGLQIQIIWLLIQLKTTQATLADPLTAQHHDWRAALRHRMIREELQVLRLEDKLKETMDARRDNIEFSLTHDGFGQFSRYRPAKKWNVDTSEQSPQEKIDSQKKQEQQVQKLLELPPEQQLQLPHEQRAALLSSGKLSSRQHDLLSAVVDPVRLPSRGLSRGSDYSHSVDSSAPSSRPISRDPTAPPYNASQENVREGHRDRELAASTVPGSRQSLRSAGTAEPQSSHKDRLPAAPSATTSQSGAGGVSVVGHDIQRLPGDTLEVSGWDEQSEVSEHDSLLQVEQVPNSVPLKRDIIQRGPIGKQRVDDSTSTVRPVTHVELIESGHLTRITVPKQPAIDSAKRDEGSLSGQVFEPAEFTAKGRGSLAPVGLTAQP